MYLQQPMLHTRRHRRTTFWLLMLVHNLSWFQYLSNICSDKIVAAIVISIVVLILETLVWLIIKPRPLGILRPQYYIYTSLLFISSLLRIVVPFLLLVLSGFQSSCQIFLPIYRILWFLYFNNCCKRDQDQVSLFPWCSIFGAVLQDIIWKTKFKSPILSNFIFEKYSGKTEFSFNYLTYFKIL